MLAANQPASIKLTLKLTDIQYWVHPVYIHGHHACPFCNSHKGPNIASHDPETSVLTRLFHPRNDRWQDHFLVSGPYLLGRTAIGRTTIALLTMNAADYVVLRESLIEEGLFP